MNIMRGTSQTFSAMSRQNSLIYRPRKSFTIISPKFMRYLPSPAGTDVHVARDWVSLACRMPLKAHVRLLSCCTTVCTATPGAGGKSSSDTATSMIMSQSKMSTFQAYSQLTSMSEMSPNHYRHLSNKGQMLSNVCPSTIIFSNPRFSHTKWSKTFRTVSCHFSNSEKSKATESMDDENKAEVEWIHPNQRKDLILENDRELKSMLRELAADFGRDDHNEVYSTGTVVSDEKSQELPSSSISEMKIETLHKDERGRGIEDGVDLRASDHHHSFEPVQSEKGKQGEKAVVFSINDLVSILREENAQDMCVISIPKEKQYVDFFVVVTGRSPRHLKAMALHINQQYKAKKTKSDPFVLVEGEQTDDWMCIDFGNIVLHLMSEETREFYELEKLWTLGPEYDDQLKRMKEYDEKMKDIVAIEAANPKEDAGNGKGESDRPTITFAR